MVTIVVKKFDAEAEAKKVFYGETHETDNLEVIDQLLMSFEGQLQFQRSDGKILSEKMIRSIRFDSGYDVRL